ncbi:MAG: hypothetical protein IPJ84_19060 [Bdellovibrionales bacterium]|nr:hypothetical protein [Bdellovibrionales bacterium]MBK7892870.1 hypothetical protein [Bdellovibrionales bacterium]
MSDLRRKDIILDFELYKKEIKDAQALGRQDGIAEARRIFLELLAGASMESLIDESDEDLRFLVEDLFDRVRMAKERVRVMALGERK